MPGAFENAQCCGIACARQPTGNLRLCHCHTEYGRHNTQNFVFRFLVKKIWDDFFPFKTKILLGLPLFDHIKTWQCSNCAIYIKQHNKCTSGHFKCALTKQYWAFQTVFSGNLDLVAFLDTAADVGLGRRPTGGKSCVPRKIICVAPCIENWI